MTAKIIKISLIMTIFAKNLHSMKRFRIFAIIFITLLFASLPLSVSGQTVIYKGMSSPNFSDHMTSDEAMIAAMVGMGYTTVSYIGDGVYKLEVTTGKKRLLLILLITQKWSITKK